MLCLSKSTGYAIKALSCLESDQCRCLIPDVAGCAGVPRPYLAKIVHALVQRGLLESKRGYRGGIHLTRSPELISLLDIVEAVEGPRWLGECLLGFEAADSYLSCPTQAFWQRIRQEIIEELRSTSLASLIARRPARSSRARRADRPRAACPCANRNVVPLSA